MPIFRDVDGNLYDIPQAELKKYKKKGGSQQTKIAGAAGGPGYVWGETNSPEEGYGWDYGEKAGPQPYVWMARPGYVWSPAPEPESTFTEQQAKGKKKKQPKKRK